MRILLIANYVPDAQQSMQRYAALLRNSFTRAGHEVRMMQPPVRLGRLKHGNAAAKWLGYVDKLVLFPRELTRASDWADVVHICDHSNSIYTKYIEARPHVVTCHDMLAIRSALGEFPEYNTRWTGRQLQRMIFDGLSRARTVVCVSEATRADVMRLLPAADRHVTRIYNGLNYPYAPMARDEAARRLEKLRLSSSWPFILHVGGNQWYKNRDGVLESFALLRRRFRNLRLVMVGKPWTPEMRQIARFHGLGGSVFELLDVAEEDLRALYSRAEALLFPSFEEGFGWPVAEAQACGCPVVTSNRAPMTEVGGEAATYFDPLDPESVVTAVGSVLGTRERHPGGTRFSTAAMVEGYLALYERVLGGNASSGAGELHLRCA